MSAATVSMRNTQVISSPPQVKQTSPQPNTNDYALSKKVKKEDPYVSNTKNPEGNTPTNQTNQNGSSTTSSQADMEYSTSPGETSTGLTTGSNGTNSMITTGSYNSAPSVNGNSHAINGLSNGIPSQYPGANGMTQNSLDPTGPLPNEIFELLNEFWRPNELVALDTHLMNGKFSRRSPDGSLDDTAEEEKDGEDDMTSLADTELGVDRNTQKRRYSRLSDGYERLKCVLPSVKDKRRVSKARILDEAINYIQRLESITNVLKREHEKRLSMLNGSNGFFPDYSVQPYMRSLFQKQMYPPGMTGSKMAQYPKMSTTPSSIPKSPRMKQYNQQYSSQSTGTGVAANMTPTDYNYNNLSSYNVNTGPMYQTNDSTQLMNGDTSPITNNSPYSACSLSPGSTPTTYQNGTTINNSWPYQTAGMTGYNDSSNSQLSSYSSRPGSNGYASSGGYSSMNGSMWGNMGMSEVTSQVVPHADHSMKVG